MSFNLSTKWCIVFLIIGYAVMPFVKLYELMQ